MKTSGLKNKLFIAYATIVIVVVMVFGAVAIGITLSLNRETELLYQQEVFRGNLSEIEKVIDRMDRLAAQVAGNSDAINAFISLSKDGDRANYFSENLVDAIRVGSLLSSINGADGYASRISVFNWMGDYVSAGTLYETPERIEAALADGEGIRALAAETGASEGQRLVSGFHADLWSNHPGISILSLYRPLAFSENATAYGLVEIQVENGRIGSLGFWQTGDAGAYCLLSESLGQIYPAQTGGTAPQIPPLGEGETYVGELAGEGLIVLAGRVALTDWVLARTLPAHMLYAPYLRNYAVIALSTLVALVILLLVVNHVADRITRPLRSFADSVAQVSLTNMRFAPDLGADGASVRELIALNEAFRAMLAKLDSAISLEMQAYMRALQSQMNPHFLFNMLSVIIESSEEEGGGRTVRMCMKLTSMLRYIANFDSDNATLLEEVAHTRNYLELMKERYEDHFSFQIEAGDGLEDVRVPRLTIQPLAENCFKHGFRNMRPPWFIHVKVYANGDSWRLMVRDNGAGFSPEAIREIESRVESYARDVAGSYSNLQIGGMGLTNTLLRLKLTSSERFSYSIYEHPEGGTVIEMGGRNL